MKKAVLIFFISLAAYSYSGAQELGVRFGDIASGNNVALDAIFSAGKFSRIHADLSFGSGVGIDAIYDFIYKPLGNEAFNWYLGAGPYVRISDPFWLGVAGEIGLEYSFKSVPISLSADWRPGLNIIETTSFRYWGSGFNVRYKF
jgi:hypothetical protein